MQACVFVHQHIFAILAPVANLLACVSVFQEAGHDAQSVSPAVVKGVTVLQRALVDAGVTADHR